MIFKQNLLFAFVLFFISCGVKPQTSNKKDKKPNILFCIADDATWKHMSAYGNTWANTPAFDQIAKEGLLFKNAYTPNAKCGPSRAIVLTGRNSWQLEDAANHLAYFPKKFKSYPEGLAQKGYHVGYTGKGWAPGTALKEDGTKRELLVKAYNSIKKEVPTTGINTVDYVENFKKFLAERKNIDSPFCFWYGGHEPHRKYEYGTGVSVGNKKLSEIDKVFPYWPDSEVVRNDMLDYAFELEYFDQQLGGMLKALEEIGELENTIIVVTADNGMPFPRAKGLSYEYSNHMPLAIMWKNGIQHPGRIIEDYVSFTDFAATFLEVSGFHDTELEMQPIQGKSLTPYFNTKKTSVKKGSENYVLLGQERHDTGRPYDVGYPIRGIVKDGYMFLINFENDRWPAGNPETGYTNTDGSPTKTEIINLNRSGINQEFWKMNFGKLPKEQLFHVAKDEFCMENLAENPKYAALKNNLKKLLESELKKQNDPRMFGNGAIFDQYEPDRSKSLYEKMMSGEDVKTPWINTSDIEKEKINID